MWQRHAPQREWLAETIHAERYSPHTANGWLDVLRVVMKAAVVRFELVRNPMDGIKNFDTSEHVYTEEEPNSLTVEEMPRFLEKMRALYPQHFAFVCLGPVAGPQYNPKLTLVDIDVPVAEALTRAFAPWPDAPYAAALPGIQERVARRSAFANQAWRPMATGCHEPFGM